MVLGAVLPAPGGLDAVLHGGVDAAEEDAGHAHHAPLLLAQPVRQRLEAGLRRTVQGNIEEPLRFKPLKIADECCGPCSTAVLEKLRDDYDVTLFFYNPKAYWPLLRW